MSFTSISAESQSGDDEQPYKRDMTQNTGGHAGRRSYLQTTEVGFVTHFGSQKETEMTDFSVCI